MPIEIASPKQRAVELEGGHNVRDMGGVPLANGKVSRHGIVFRGPALTILTERGRAQFDQMEIKRSIDLREAPELEILDCSWMADHGIEMIHAPSGIPRKQEIDPDLKIDPHKAKLEDMRYWKVAGYRTKPAELADAMRILYESICADANNPVYFHCAGGADRTGLMAAVLLKSLGADHDLIIGDYLHTNLEKELRGTSGRGNRSIEEILSAYGLAGLSAEAREALSLLLPEYLETSLTAIDERFGGIETYLVDHCKISEDTLETVRERMVMDQD